MRLSSKVTLVAGDKEYTLCLNMNALCEIEERMNVNIMSEDSFWENMGFLQLREVLYALLHKEDPRPTLEEVGEIMSDVSMEELGEAMTALWQMDADGEKKKGKRKVASDPTKD